MELAQIIKWVDEKNMNFRTTEFDLSIIEDGQDEISINPNDYTSEYNEYQYALINYLLLMDLENKKALVRRLFRGGYSFFNRCCKQREETNDGLWLFTMKTSIFIPPYEDSLISISSALWTQMCIEHELVNFYAEVLQLCIESELNPIELCPFEHKGLDDVFADMALFSKTQPTNKMILEKYISKDTDKVLKVIDNEMANAKKGSGRIIALIICALEKFGYIETIDGKVEKLHRAFVLRYKDRVGTRQSVSAYIEATRNPKSTSQYKGFTDNELNDFGAKLNAQ